TLGGVVPALGVSPPSLTFTTVINTECTAQGIAIAAANLAVAEEVSVSVSSGFEMSVDGGATYGSGTLYFAVVGGAVQTNVLVRLVQSGTINHAISGTLTAVASGVSPATVTLSGDIWSGVDSVALAAWNFTGITAQNDNPLAVMTTTNTVSVGALTLGYGVTTANGDAGSTFGGTGWVDATMAAAEANGRYISFTVTANPGFATWMDSLSMAFRRSGGGATNCAVRVQAGDTPFVTVWSTNGMSESGTSTFTIPPVDLSGIPSLQEVAPGTVVTFRIVPWYGASGGAFYLNNAVNNGDDLVLQGYTLMDAGQPVFLLPPQNVKAQSASASRMKVTWDAVANATGYEVDLYGYRYAPVSEDFETCATGRGGIRTNAILSTPYVYFNTAETSLAELPGWTMAGTSAAFLPDQDGNATNRLLKIGTSGAAGWLETPLLKQPDGAGAVSVTFDVVAWSNVSERTTIDLIVADAMTGEASTNAVPELPRDGLETRSVMLPAVPELFTVRISGQQGNNRFFLANLVVTGAQKREVVSNTYPATTGTTLKINGLTEGETYYGVVRALNDTLHLVSPDSDEFTLTLKAPGTVLIIR
ncbi:MAG: hypothetical protein FWF84_05725, partial [Kiritimatiellaeota bacterium]|nr:hypothetical protein [Kiritimatiellota bacterium]